MGGLQFEKGDCDAMIRAFDSQGNRSLDLTVSDGRGEGKCLCSSVCVPCLLIVRLHPPSFPIISIE